MILTAIDVAAREIDRQAKADKRVKLLCQTDGISATQRC
jgi:hypothetical protein